MNRNERAFTLIEVLIVIVILAVLASLILPMMMAQPERALIAEAVNYLGVIRRAQESIVGLTQGSWIAASAGMGGYTDAGWQGLGLGPLQSESSFTYFCNEGPYDSMGVDSTSPGVCVATRKWGGGEKNGGNIVMRLNTGTITACEPPYVLTGPSGAPGTTCA